MVRAGIVPVKLKIINQVAQTSPALPLPVRQTDLFEGGGGLPIVNVDKSLYRVRVGRSSDSQTSAHRIDPHSVRVD
jgi:hypothetical protein